MLKQNLFLAIYGLVLSGGVLLSLKLAQVSWRRRSAPGAVPLIVVNLTAAWWMLCYVAPLPDMSRSEEIFLRFRMIFAGVVFICPAMLAFALQYTGRKISFHWRSIAPFLIEPAIVLLAVWWPPLHDEFFGDWRGRPDDGHFKGGVLFWAHTVYSYALMMVTYTLLIRHYRMESVLYRKQIRILLLGISIPSIFNIVTISGLFLPNIDVSPLGFVIGAAIMMMAVFKRGLLDLIPVAREKIVQVIHEGVLVVDTKDRIVDSNPAAYEILELGRKPTEGCSLDEVVPQWQAVSIPVEGSNADTEMFFPNSGKYVELHAIPLADGKGVPSGRLLVLRDITAAKLASNALEKANLQLRSQLLEIESMQNLLREQAIRDPLTGLFNRRYLEETLHRELRQAQRTRNPLALVMIDIDHFKKVNDVHGHACGDAVLRALGTMLLQKSRAGDVACRYGGEEFIVILTGTSLDTALQRAEQWRAEFSAMRLPCNGIDLSASFSAGVAVFPDHGLNETSLLGAADRALYAAKAAGRNWVQLARS